MSQQVTSPQPRQKREFFGSRNMFILAAIGSAVGLGNIWRFPYVAYENGGGAFIVPYVIAVVCAGIPLLFFDYAIGHRYGGSAPLSMARISRWLESIGWWQVLICFIIGIYYAVIVAWAAMFMIYSVTGAWGDDPNGFFFGDFLQVSETVGFTGEFVPHIFWPSLLVWAVTFIVIFLGVNKGIAGANLIFMPLLVIMFLIMVVQALFLPGAMQGLDALFTPDWSALARGEVWAAAVGQIFFSLSVGFGIMITYASYLKRKSDLTGSGMVVGFSNSAFEILAGIGVFAALGFMAQAAGTSVDETATSGIGLAFVAFPTIISQAPMGELIGVLFFGSLVFAGFTSMVSIIEVVVAGVRDKLGLTRQVAAIAVIVPMAIISLLLFPTTAGLYFLDVFDWFVNQYGIMAAAFVAIVCVGWICGKLPVFSRHLTKLSSIPANWLWILFVGAIVPVALAYMLYTQLTKDISEVYGGYPPEFVAIFGWGMVAALVVIAIILTALPWSKRVDTSFDEAAEDAEVEAIYQARLARERGERIELNGTEPSA